MFEVDEAARIISGTADPDANVIFGAVVKDGLSDQVRITVIATGFDESRSRIAQMVRPNQPASIQGMVGESPKQEGEMPESGMERVEKKEGLVEQTKKDEFGEDFDIPAFLRKIH